METDVAPNPETLFRPVKRRKFLRRRVGSDHDEDHHQNEPQQANDDSRHHSTPRSSQEADDAAPTTGILRLRRQYRPRAGIEFSTTSRQSSGPAQPPAKTSGEEDVESLKIQSMCDRFTAHTGQKVDVDKHMMDYIESEMAKRHRHDVPSDTRGTDTPPADEATGGPSASRDAQREPATLGKLHEIDLGQETRLRNIARTQAATKKLAGDDGAPAAEESTQKTEPGKDGKAWRGRKGRNSEDVERDRLVEEVLRESKLDVYEEPPQEDQQDDQAADDKIAEQFRREFIDALHSRRRFARARRDTKTAKPDVPRGPKLGGSRSARAAMRERQEKTK